MRLILRELSEFVFKLFFRDFVIKYSNTQILKYSNTQILKYSNTQILKYSNTQIKVYLLVVL